MSRKKSLENNDSVVSHRLIIGLPLLAAVVFCFGFSLMQPSERPIKEGAARQTDSERALVNHTQLPKAQLEQQPGLAEVSATTNSAPTTTASPQTAAKKASSPQSGNQIGTISSDAEIKVKAGPLKVNLSPKGLLGDKKN